MSTKNKKIKNLFKFTAITLLTGFIYITNIKQEVYALQNNNISSNSVLRSSIEYGKVNPCDFLNIRSGASVNSNAISKVYTGDSVQIIEKNNNGWYKIITSSNISGWVNGKYITIESSSSNTSKTKKIVDLAYKQIGKKYSWGSSGPNTFDCSGLTSYVYKNSVSVNLPRTSKEQSKYGQTVSKSQLQAGDLLFFGSGKTVSHVGIYIGDSKMIHSPSTGQTVRVENINSSYYSKRLITAKRIL